MGLACKATEASSAAPVPHGSHYCLAITALTTTPVTPAARGEIVFQKTDLWCQIGWGLLS